MNFREGYPGFTLGSILAFLVLIAVFVLLLMGQIDTRGALLFGGLALAILLR